MTSQNSPLPAGKINCLAIDGRGAVWLGTDSGAWSYLAHEWTILRDQLSYFVYISEPPFAIPQHTVTSIASGRSGAVWFGLDGGGARRYHQFSTSSVWKKYYLPDLPSNSVTAIAADKTPNGDVYVCSVWGVRRFVPSAMVPDDGIWQDVVIPDLTFQVVRAASMNPNDNSICFGTLDGAAFYDGGSRWSNYSFPVGYDYPTVSIAFDLANTVWFGKWNGAGSVNLVHREDEHQYTYETTDGSLPPGSVNAIATDLNITRWFGTNRGLIRLQDTTWTTFNRQNSPLPSDTITALSYDPGHNLWIGTAQGLAVFNENGTRL